MTLASSWRTKHQRLNLTGEVCPHCGVKLFPPRDVCPHCQGPAKTEFHFKGTGQVYSYSTLYNAPAGFAYAAPYVVALVKLDEGPLVTAQLTDIDPEQVSIGMLVEMVTRKTYQDGDDGLIMYNYKFRPILARAYA